ncbi:MAG: low temperature requirement protein A [Rhizobiaceae bacterium]
MSPFMRPLTPRDSTEQHRAATPLELFFDLVSVIAIAVAAEGLHHSIIEAHALQGIITFIMAFFAIWWAWMNYTWFASAYDNDDTLFRLLTLVIMSGSLIMAAGISSLFKSADMTLMVIGYVIMRLGMIALWLRAAYHDPDNRSTAITYAIGIGFTQLLWIGYLVLQPNTPIMAYGLYFLLVLMELMVPVIAERKNKSPWHRHHIIERYGLLTIIVLGETLLAGGLAFQQVANGSTDSTFLYIALSSLVIVFSMWWMYFSKEDHLISEDFNHVVSWGYGHIVIFAAGGAVGAGFAVLVDIAAGHAKVPMQVGEYAVSIPVTIYMLGLWFVRDRFAFNGAAQYVLPLFAVLILLMPLTPIALAGMAVLMALSVAVRSILAEREA